jgi:hypothetical protein
MFEYNKMEWVSFMEGETLCWSIEFFSWWKQNLVKITPYIVLKAKWHAENNLDYKIPCKFYKEQRKYI